MKLVACALLVVTSSLAWGDDPSLDPIDKALAVQKAMADAKDLLTAGDPAGAAKALETQLAQANVNRAFLELLTKAYHGELSKLRSAGRPDSARIETITKRLAILEGNSSKSNTTVKPPASPASSNDNAVATAPSTPLLREATRNFHDGKRDPSRYREAAALFAKAQEAGETFNADQKAAWAYCKLNAAADEINQPSANAATIQAATSDVKQALALAPGQTQLQQTGATILSAVGASATSNPADWQAITGDGFRVRHRGQAELAQSILAAATQQRQQISSKWFGPAGPAWNPLCEIVLHASASEFATATKLSPALTGHAEVTLDGGKVASRRIDLRADDDSIRDVTLPRELTHILIADLFPTKAPPRWAEEGMAILSTNQAEVSRFKRAIPRLVADGGLPNASDLIQTHGFPTADRITGFYVGSVTLTEYLVGLNGEKAFAAFLTDSQRYGLETALRRQYHVTPAQLDGVWTKSR